MNILKIIGAVLLFLVTSTCLQAQPEVPAKPEPTYRPFDAVAISGTDAVAVQVLADPTILPEYCRYLSLHNFPKEVRPRIKLVVDVVLNSFNSRYGRLIKTAAAPADDPVVLRVNLKDYNISPAAWDKLAETGSGPTPIPDPYFHATYIKTKLTYREYEKVEWWPGGVWPNDGKLYPPNSFRYQKTHREEIGRERTRMFQAAPWLSLEPEGATPGATLANLMHITKTKNPILRADWFIVYATWAPRYYEFIGLERKQNKEGKWVFLEKDFNKLLKLDEIASAEDLVAGIADTKVVTLHNRILHRYPTANGIYGGYVWESNDTDAGINAEDYILNIHKFDKPKIKAREIIGASRNRLHLYAVSNDKGELIDFAAQQIAIHGDQMPTKWQDKTVWVGRSCMLCHAGGQIFIKDKVRALAQGKIMLLINSLAKQDEGLANHLKADPTLFKKIEEAFSPDLQPIIDSDNAKYLTAIRALTGLDGKEFGQLYEEVVWQYFDTTIGPEKAALEAGVPVDRLIAALQRGVNLDYNVTALLQNPPVEVSRLPWENQGHFSMMQQLLAWEAAQKK